MAADQPFVREDLSRDDALARLDGQDFKREIIESIGAEEGEVAAGDAVSLYRNGGWADLCLGPHVPSTGRLGSSSSPPSPARTGEATSTTPS